MGFKRRDLCIANSRHTGMPHIVYLTLCDYVPDDKLMFTKSVPWLARRLRIGQNTVKRALKTLCESGDITRVEKGPTVVAYMIHDPAPPLDTLEAVNNSDDMFG